MSASVAAPVSLLVLLDLLLEGVWLGVEHDLGEHLHEAAIGVVAEALVATEGDQPLHRLVVEAEVEHGIHHARHGELRAGADGDEQRILGVAELLARLLLDDAQRREHLIPHPLGEGFAAVGAVVGVAGLGGDGKAGRHRQPGVGHLGDARALAAEQVAHLGVALGEEIDPFLRGSLHCFFERRLFRLSHRAILLLRAQIRHAGHPAHRRITRTLPSHAVRMGGAHLAPASASVARCIASCGAIAHIIAADAHLVRHNAGGSRRS